MGEQAARWMYHFRGNVNRIGGRGHMRVDIIKTIFAKFPWVRFTAPQEAVVRREMARANSPLSAPYRGSLVQRFSRSQSFSFPHFNVIIRSLQLVEASCAFVLGVERD